MKKYMYQVVDILRKIYWFIFQIHVRSVKLVIENQDKLLMVRHTYGRHRWTFPGGGIQHQETDLAAIKREIQEELGIKLADIESLGEVNSPTKFGHHTLVVFYTKIPSLSLKLASDEILEAKTFGANDLPPNLSKTAFTVLELYSSQQKHKHFRK